MYATKGYDALIAWLEDRGVKNIKALNEVLAKGAKPWWDFYGGKKKIKVTWSTLGGVVRQHVLLWRASLFVAGGAVPF